VRPNLLLCLERASREYGISRGMVLKRWMDEDLVKLERAEAIQEEALCGQDSEGSGESM